METYSLLREFADSWMLLLLTVTFVVICGWAFRPGSRSTHDDAARLIFRNDKKPARDTASGTAGQNIGRPDRNLPKEPSK